MPKSLADLVEQMQTEAPLADTMLEALECDAEDLARALLAKCHMETTPMSLHARLTESCHVLNWGIAIGYFYACKKYRELLEAKGAGQL